MADNCEDRLGTGLLPEIEARYGDIIGLIDLIGQFILPYLFTWMKLLFYGN